MMRNMQPTRVQVASKKARNRRYLMLIFMGLPSVITGLGDSLIGNGHYHNPPVSCQTCSRQSPDFLISFIFPARLRGKKKPRPGTNNTFWPVAIGQGKVFE
jgi:hypothetical protein